MQHSLVHEIELYPPETFKSLLDHEVNKSRRYGDSLTLVDLVVEANPMTEQTQHGAEIFMINTLNLHLRETDIPCKKGNEFLILLPATSEQGARTTCERLKRLMVVEHQEYDRVSFEVMSFIGLAALPNDRSLPSNGLAQNAAKALQHARTHQIAKVISFSEIKE